MATTGSDSTVSLQAIVDIAQAFGDIEPILNVQGSSAQPALTIANDVMNAICSVAFPWKWNEILLPYFYTNSYQQDYALLNANGTSVTNLSWLERGVAFNISSTAIPKPWALVECGRQLVQATATNVFSFNSNPTFVCNYFPNSTLYYGTWGQPDTLSSTLGNNPVAGSVYTNPILAANQPSNPITQIRDANGNLLVLTTYGTEGSAAPLAAPNAAPGTTASGTGATTVWTVIDPRGQGIRILPVPSQTGVVWEFQLIGQALPTRFTNLQQTLYPLPDQYEPNFRQGFVAQCYRYSSHKDVRAKFKDEWQLWLAAINDCRVKSDRELEENMFVPNRGIMGGNRRNNRWLGSGWPFDGPPGA